jgi:hypothetical protein
VRPCGLSELVRPRPRARRRSSKGISPKKSAVQQLQVNSHLDLLLILCENKVMAAA